MAGSLFGALGGFAIICVLTTIGASCCYWLSYTVGRRAAERVFANQLAQLRQTVTSQQDNLPFYLLFLRLVPMTPNWLLNILCPLVGVRYTTFAGTVFFGLMPYNFVCTSAGSLLRELKSVNDIFDSTTVIRMLAMAFLALTPVAIKYFMRSKTVAATETKKQE
jgi:uncharacterized membrane protein YdjX (TVP38/TMEM64 family)